MLLTLWAIFRLFGGAVLMQPHTEGFPREGPGQDRTEIPGFGAGKTRLPIPVLLEDTDPSPGRDEFHITARNGSREFFPGVSTDTLGYNGDYLGPVIRTRKGQTVTVHVENRIRDEMTTIHWHGLEVSGENDGGPHSGIRPGETWTPEFTVDQPAATLWYHPHPEGNTGRQVYKGLAGLFIIDDEISDSLELPADYGVNDIPLVIQDKRFRQDGSFDYMLGGPDIMFGLQGNTVLVNGQAGSYLEVEKGLMRFRILNGSNATIFEFQLDNGRNFHQIASDGGFLERPVETNRLVLGPSERAEILIDFSDYEEGDTVQLAAGDYPFLDFVIDGSRENGYSVPAVLAPIERLDPAEAAGVREFVFLGMGADVSINGRQFDRDRIDEFVRLGDTEIWEVSNRSVMGMMGGTPHPFHAHGTRFQILSRNGSRPPENETGWKDSFVVYPQETVRAIARFRKPGVFMYHCHILEHEDAGMMGQFQVK